MVNVVRTVAKIAIIGQLLSIVFPILWLIFKKIEFLWIQIFGYVVVALSLFPGLLWGIFIYEMEDKIYHDIDESLFDYGENITIVILCLIGGLIQLGYPCAIFYAVWKRHKKIKKFVITCLILSLILGIFIFIFLLSAALNG